MPFTILKIPKDLTDPHEVIGEFAEESDAQHFIEGLPPIGPNDDHDYLVEPPPSVTNPTND